MHNTPPSPINTSASIGRLPNEILSEIFLCVHDWVAIQPDSDEPFEGAPECVFLSHVCQRWRDVAIACQRLWALLPRNNIEWTRACVARAHSIPVNLRFDIWVPDPRLRIPRRLAFPLISRAETLTLYIELDRYTEARRDATEVLQGLAAHAAPLLEELKITLDQNFTWEEYQPTSISSLFNGETPHKLRLVDLEGCLL
ncbi:hypothetical protein PENSPDRAFT_38505 [Peniophora sp. CONT]|nr:hypothetical protein PENSPDRAFT_38505 [Peniophora sp. CONT]